MKRVPSLYKLDKRIASKLQSIDGRSDNFIDSGVGLHPIRLVKNPYYMNMDVRFLHYINDLRTLRKIDETDLSTPKKLLFYYYYLNGFSFEEMYEIVDDFTVDTKHADLSHHNHSEFETHLLQKLGVPNSENVGKEFREGILGILTAFPPKPKKLARLIHLNHFMNNADDGESFAQFHKDVDVDEVDYSLVHDYPYTKQIVQSFTYSTAGSMGEGISKRVVEQLEQLNKDEFSKLLQVAMPIKSTESLRRVLDDGVVRTRSPKENSNIVFNQLCKKLGVANFSNSEDLMGEILRILYESKSSYLNSSLSIGEKTVLNTLRTQIVHKAENELDTVSLRTTLALYIAFLNTKFWIDTRDEVSALFLLNELLDKDFMGTMRLIEHVVLESPITRPTLKQWKQIKEQELFTTVPNLAFTIVGVTDSDKEFDKYGQMKELRRISKDI